MIMREGRALREAGGGDVRSEGGGEVIKESCFTENRRVEGGQRGKGKRELITN